MDFWQFGIYIVILTGASSLVIMTIILILRKMSQNTSPQRRDKNKATVNEWAKKPPTKIVAESPVPPISNQADRSEAAHNETTQMEPGTEDAEQYMTEEMSLTSPLSAPGTIEPALLAGASVLDPPATADTLLTGITSAIPGEDNQTNEDDETAKDDSDPLSIFQLEDTQENSISELSASLPDIDVSSLLREGKEVLRILGVEAEEY